MKASFDLCEGSLSRFKYNFDPENRLWMKSYQSINDKSNFRYYAQNQWSHKEKNDNAG